ncbi:sarcosine oxidase subunit gamma [Mesorhizobium sp. M8A.F.Ca.ET.059.01.1.1]|nr:sarcosine oxidase subunit gamma [Mesorhizobium sp. M8A.F.Ca.ET.059.01.1.1]
MSEFRVTLRPALATMHPVASDRIALEALAEGHVIHVLGKPGDEGLAARLAPLSDGSAHAVRFAGPGQWYIVGDGMISHAELTALSEALKPDGFGIDQSQGRVRILAKGLMVERVLAKGTGVDLSLAAFPVGHSTTTLIGHIAAHVTRTGENAFEIMVLRGFAESLWDDLARMCAEYI